MGSAHTLKTWPAYFAAVLDGSKTFEVRSHLDRTFRLGDEMELAEFDPHAGDGGQFTGRTVKVVITYILGGGQFGIDTGVCVLGIKLVPIDDLTALRAENARLRAAVRAADAMARALLDKSSGAHECNGGPERCWYCADAESDRAVVSAFDQARAKGDV